jgi:hypothetical protein
VCVCVPSEVWLDAKADMEQWGEETGGDAKGALWFEHDDDGYGCDASLSRCGAPSEWVWCIREREGEKETEEGREARGSEQMALS